MDMRFHRLRCRDAQGQFHYYWRPGTQNLADYFTKHHPATHHKITSYHTNSCQRSRIQKTLCDTRKCIANQLQIWREKQRTTNKSSGCHKIFCQNSLTDSQVPKHDSSEKCLRILRQDCVRPISKYVSFGGKDSRLSYETP